MRAQLTIAAACSALAFCTAAPPEFDLVVRGGEVIDGSGEGSRRADVGVKGDRITAVGDLGSRRAGQTIVATGKVVSPGFIDALGEGPLALLADGSAHSHIRQGITSQVLADGADPAFWPERVTDRGAFVRQEIRFDWGGLGGYFDRLENAGTSVNVGALVPARAGDDDGVDTAMRAGALGVANVSSVESAARDRGGLLSLALRTAPYGGIVATRLSGAAATAAQALEGALQAGAEARVPVVILDPRGSGPDAANSLQSVLARIRLADSAGQRAFVTIVPYGHPDMTEDGVRAALGHAFVAVGTGAAASRPDGRAGEAADPAAFGAMPRVLGRYARDLGVMSSREAVRRLTSQAALQYGIPLRGIVREGYYADLVVFDPATVIDRATIERPAEYPAGIDYVIVNGVVTVTPRGHTGARAGRRLLGPGGRAQP